MKRLIRVAFFLVLSIMGADQVNAQTLDPTFASIDIQQSGIVYSALQQPDGKYLVGGSFTQVNGSPVVGLARLNADGTLDNAFTNTAACESIILRIRLLANGQILLQGNSIKVGGRTFSTLAKLNADGTIATDFTPGSGASSVTAVAVQTDGKILVGGTFTNYSGVATNSLVRLNTDGSVDQAFVSAIGEGFVQARPTSSGPLRGVVVQPDNKILVCGDFQNYNNTGRGSLIRLNADGSLDTGFNPVSSMSPEASRVMALALDPRTNYILVYYGNFTAQHIARLNTSGQNDATFSLSAIPNCVSTGNLNSEQFAVDASGRVLLSSCFIDEAAPAGNNFLVRYLANGQLDSQFAIGKQLDGSVNSIKVLASGDVLLGGAFSRYGSIRNISLVRVNDNAQASATLRPAIMQLGSIQDLVQQSDGRMLVAGRFWQINGQAVGNVARLNVDGTLDPTFQLTEVDGRVRRVAVQPDGRIVLGGEFTMVGSHASPLVARLLPDGRPDISFTTPPAKIRYGASALALQADGSVLVGGSGLSIGGYYSNLHRLLSNGSIDASYVDQVGRGPLSVLDLAALPNDQCYAGGFSVINSSGTVFPGVVRLNADGSRDNAFTSSPQANFVSIYKLLPLPNGQVLAGGVFSSYNNEARTNLVRLNSDGSVDMSYVPPVLSGVVSELARYANGRVLISGSSLTVNGIPSGPLVRLNPDGTHDASFTNVLGTSSITALALQADEAIMVGGPFTQVNGQPRASLTRLTAPTVLAIGSRQSSARTEVWPNPVQEVLHLSLDAVAKPRTITLSDALGKTVLCQAASQAKLTLPISHLPAGVYLLRVDYADGPVTRRVVVQ